MAFQKKKEREKSGLFCLSCPSLSCFQLISNGLLLSARKVQRRVRGQAGELIWGGSLQCLVCAGVYRRITRFMSRMPDAFCSHWFIFREGKLQR